jgi:hypothetical protein
MSPGGDIRYLAPEVINAFNHARYYKEGDVSYAGQPAWELGTMLFELATGLPAWPDYPDAYLVNGAVMCDSSTLLPWLPAEYPLEVRTTIAALLDSNPAARPKIRVVEAMLRELRVATLGPGYPEEPQWPADVSVTGEWAAGRSCDGVFIKVPLDKEATALVLRDNLVARIAPEQ